MGFCKDTPEIGPNQIELFLQAFRGIALGIKPHRTADEQEALCASHLHGMHVVIGRGIDAVAWIARCQLHSRFSPVDMLPLRFFGRGFQEEAIAADTCRSVASNGGQPDGLDFPVKVNRSIRPERQRWADKK